ncbi:Heat shock factor protein HSF24 [Galdieria sulphuraria]|uniref:Heat shock transcription n=1 Tax=Galdieria sulphuraria TaxID=130081 RepID=M2XIN7_GALSU|nr:heat shock transcription [Galdieria sulphuraria]EME29952.1 heat shock transcription [Galdieria sulphuraria]GJD12003.1 Heat shock factor protein HSF24 [Galdieria sulphuraria]|eukprot:XP_005706472.1 heat shock transcription [Galdieria sulphuraria]
MFVGNHEKDERSEFSSKDLSSSSADDNAGNNKRGETSTREDVARFVRKLVSFVDDPSCDDIVSWNETGTGFVIWDSNAFCLKVLSCYFRHTNLSSFVRQLNQYGFRKTAHSRWEFCHDSFRRGRPELLGEIKRVSVSSNVSGKSSKALLHAQIPTFVDFSPSFGLPFTYSAADLQQEFMDMDRVESTLVNLQEEAKLLMTNLEESKLQCDELKLYLEYGNSATQQSDVAQDKVPEPKAVGQSSSNSLKNDPSFVPSFNRIPAQEQQLRDSQMSEALLSQQRLDEGIQRQGSSVEGFSSLPHPTRFTSELVYRRWIKAQLQREAELRKLQLDREWRPS